jgi:hypothetical protein
MFVGMRPERAAKGRELGAWIRASRPLAGCSRRSPSSPAGQGTYNERRADGSVCDGER